MKDLENLKKMGDELSGKISKVTVEGASGAGMVKAKATGKGDLISIELTDEAYSLGKESLEVLVASAVNDALMKAKEAREAIQGEFFQTKMRMFQS